MKTRTIIIIIAVVAMVTAIVFFARPLLTKLETVEAGCNLTFGTLFKANQFMPAAQTERESGKHDREKNVTRENSLSKWLG